MAAVVDAGTDASGGSSYGGLTDPSPIPDRFVGLAATLDAERASLGAPSAAIALLEHDEVVFAHGFGSRTPDGEPALASTLFRIGSLTKGLTATALLSLADEGRIDTQATLASVAPDVVIRDGDATKLTIHDLLSQQSGLSDYLTFSGSSDDAALATFLTSSSFTDQVRLMVPPGTFWDYSNPNFSLVGLAIERTGDEPYRQAVARRVLAPLGMTRTFFLPSEAIADGDYAVGVSRDASGATTQVAPDAYDNAWGRPAGFAFSSVLDFARFVRFLGEGDPRVLSDSRRAAMESRQVSTDEIGAHQGYGYGIRVDDGIRLDGLEWVPRTVLSHSGDIEGFAADFVYMPSTGFGVVIFAAADGAHCAGTIATALSTFGAFPSYVVDGLPPECTAKPATFAPLAGHYFDAGGVIGRADVTVDDLARLRIELPDLDAAGVPYDQVLAPTTRDNFMLRLDGHAVDLTFLTDASGTYTWLRARDFVAQRQAPFVPLRAKSIDPAALRARLAHP